MGGKGVAYGKVEPLGSSKKRRMWVYDGWTQLKKKKLGIKEFACGEVKSLGSSRERRMWVYDGWSQEKGKKRGIKELPVER